jgi:hypothetical protein
MRLRLDVIGDGENGRDSIGAGPRDGDLDPAHCMSLKYFARDLQKSSPIFSYSATQQGWQLLNR